MISPCPASDKSAPLSMGLIAKCRLQSSQITKDRVEVYKEQGIRVLGKEFSMLRMKAASGEGSAKSTVVETPLEVE